MRSRRHDILMALMLVIMSAMCVSCRQELCYDHYPTIDLHFAWELEWERDYGMSHLDNWNPEIHRYHYDELRPEVPEWVKMVRFFDNGRRAERFFKPEGAKFEVEENSTSSLLLYNGDTEYIILEELASLKDVRATATSRTRAGATLEAMQDMYHVSRTTNPPDIIYSAYIENVAGVQFHEVRPIIAKMQPLVYTYLVTFEFEHGIEHVALARGAWGGMAEGVYLRTGVTTDETTIILFDCDVHSDACRCKVRSFGVPSFPDSYFGRTTPGVAGTYSINLELKLKNGVTKEFNFDISDQMKNQPRGGVIKIDGIRIEDSEAESSSSAGFTIDISGWDDDVEDIDLPLK